MKRVLFLCTENACRSQMAEAVTNWLLGREIRAFSAGTRPSKVNPYALEVLNEMGIEPEGARSKHVSEFMDEDFDLVVTLCGGAKESCPFWAGQGRRLHFGLPDPASATGTSREILASFRKVRDRIADELISLLKKELELEEPGDA